MSEICIGVVEHLPEHRKQEFQKKVVEIVSQHGFGVFFSLDYDEPLLKHYDVSSIFLFSLADSYRYDNCDFLLLPDGCFYNDKTNTLSSRQRLGYISEILRLFTEQNYSVNLFLADSGDEYEEYRDVVVTADQFVEVLLEAYRKTNHLRYSYHFCIL